MLDGFKFNVSHQEIERILAEVEAWWECASEQAGVEWLPVEGIENFLMNDLGYEDMDEFEDAIQGSFSDFLAAFPQIEVKVIAEKTFLRITPPKPGPPRKLIFRAESSKQLVEVCFMKATDAEVEIPCIEFGIGADQKRHIDSVYNHIITARDNLENHCQHLAVDSDERESIMKTVTMLAKLVDVEEPFDIIVIDRTGMSEFKPADAVRIEPLDGAGLATIDE